MNVKSSRWTLNPEDECYIPKMNVKFSRWMLNPQDEC